MQSPLLGSFAGFSVAVEGVDLVGKTTLAARLAQDFGLHYLYTPQLPFTKIRHEVEELRDSATRFHYYLAAVMGVQPTLMNMLDKGVVIDRYIDSTIVMHQELGVSMGHVVLSSLPILRPSLTIVLTADRSVRAERRQSRPEETRYDAWIEQTLDLTDRAQLRYVALGHPVIDTSALTIPQVYDQALQILDEVRTHV